MLLATIVVRGSPQDVIVMIGGRGQAMTGDELSRTIADAVLELCCHEGTLEERFLASTHKFNLALLLLHGHDRWPNPLLQRAEEIGIDLHSQIAHSREKADCHESVFERQLVERMLQLYAAVQSTDHNADNCGAGLRS